MSYKLFDVALTRDALKNLFAVTFVSLQQLWCSHHSEKVLNIFFFPVSIITIISSRDNTEIHINLISAQLSKHIYIYIYLLSTINTEMN